MNSKQLIVGLILIAGCTGLVAAQNEPRRVDKHGVVTSKAAAGVPDKPREPVTFLGVAVAPAEPALAAQLRLPEGQGLVVNVVEPDSPAAKAGLQRHDLLTKLDDQILIDPRQLSVLVRNRKEGDAVTVTYVRGGAEARATATLATHVPGPEPFFHWMGRGGADEVIFHTEKFGPSANAELLSPNSPHSGLARPGIGFRTGPGAPSVKTISGDRAMIFRPQAGVVFSDEAGSLVMQLNEAGQMLTARNAEGEVIFEGPVTTPEQRAALPDDVRERLEKFEELDVFETPALPSSGTTRIVPGEPAIGSSVL